MQEIQARRAPKGSVRVIESHGRLQIYFRVGGKRYYLSTGFADTSINRIDVEAKAQLIENDILNERFDPTLAKYKPASALSTVTPDPPPTLTMRGLWAQYMEHRSGSVAPKTIGSTYRSVTVHLERCSADPLVDALQFRRELLEATTKLQARRTLMQLSACAKWALKHRMISTNPFAGMYNELDKDIPAPPCAFSLEERDSIIEAFENHQVKGGGISYAYYAPLVKFLFWTGCRPCEAIGLRWSSVSTDCSRVEFHESIVSINGTLVRREETKTGVKRIFNCGNKLQALLRTIRPENISQDDLVFPSRTGKAINIGDFSQRAWSSILKGLNLQYKNSSKMTPYAMRDTFISHQIRAGVSADVVSKWCGNSSEVISKKYLDKLQLEQLKPVEL